MKIVVACGGTGGHTFPGIAVAEELVRRGHEVVVWSSGRDIESCVMKRWSGPVFATGAKQLALKNLLAIFRAILRCRREIKRIKPDALLAMGSYSSLPPVLAARSRGIKVFLHEANTVPGKAVEFLSKFADAVAISFKTTAKYMPDIKTILTGLPVRSDITLGKRFEFIPVNAFTVFVTGGSQGAHAVNELTSKALVMVNNELKRRCVERTLYVIHQTGIKDEKAMIDIYRQNAIPSRVHAFEREMADAFASAEIVIARAGASTCFELAICGKPALLIPLPTAMRNHQHYNAESFAENGAADECMQDQISAKQIAKYLLSLYDKPEKLATMSKRMLGLANPDAAGNVAEMVIKGIDGDKQ